MADPKSGDLLPKAMPRGGVDHVVSLDEVLAAQAAALGAPPMLPKAGDGGVGGAAGRGLGAGLGRGAVMNVQQNLPLHIAISQPIAQNLAAFNLVYGVGQVASQAVMTSAEPGLVGLHPPQLAEPGKEGSSMLTAGTTACLGWPFDVMERAIDRLRRKTEDVPIGPLTEEPPSTVSNKPRPWTYPELPGVYRQPVDIPTKDCNVTFYIQRQTDKYYPSFGFTWYKDFWGRTHRSPMRLASAHFIKAQLQSLIELEARSKAAWFCKFLNCPNGDTCGSLAVELTDWQPVDADAKYDTKDLHGAWEATPRIWSLKLTLAWVTYLYTARVTCGCP